MYLISVFSVIGDISYMFMPHDCKYNIYSGRRNGLMSGGSTIIVVWIMRYVGTKMLDKSDTTHWKNQSILLFDLSLDRCNVSVFLTPQSYHSGVWGNHFIWSVLNSRNKLKHFYGNTLWQWHTNSGRVPECSVAC